VSKETMEEIITTLDDLKSVTNTPCDLTEFTSEKIVLECQNGWKETYIKVDTPADKLTVKSIELK
jgi:hypothetical protein